MVVVGSSGVLFTMLPPAARSNSRFQHDAKSRLAHWAQPILVRRAMVALDHVPFDARRG